MEGNGFDTWLLHVIFHTYESSLFHCVDILAIPWKLKRLHPSFILYWNISDVYLVQFNGFIREGGWGGGGGSG